MTNIKVDHTQPNASALLSRHLLHLMSAKPLDHQLVVVCIGTDRSTGDALGPLVGSRLTTLLSDEHPVYGTLENPVHAVNLADTLATIRRLFTNPYIIAVDACLGQLNSVGTISIGSGPLKPGAGVNKNLPEVGNVHITGIVNVGGFMEYFVLQNTRLSVVMKMAECISQTLSHAILSSLHVPSYKEARLESNYL